MPMQPRPMAETAGPAVRAGGFSWWRARDRVGLSTIPRPPSPTCTVRPMSDDAAAASVPVRPGAKPGARSTGFEPQRGAPSTSPIARYLDPDRHAREVQALRRLPHAIGPVARLKRPATGSARSCSACPSSPCAAATARCGPSSTSAAIAARSSCRPRLRRGQGALRLPVPQLDLRRPRRARRPAARRRLRPCRARGRVARGAAGRDPPRARVGRARSARRLRLDRLVRPARRRARLARLRRGVASPHERRFVQPSNWKLVLDANLESYHFQYAHRATIAHLFHDNVVQQESFGRHQRIVLPKRSLVDADAGDDAIDWPTLGRHSNIIYFFFPVHLRAVGGRSRQRLQRHARDSRRAARRRAG